MPVTVTGRTNVTPTSICSPSPYVLSLDGALDIATPLTADAVNVPPATLWPALFDIANPLEPGPRQGVLLNVFVLVPASLIVDPLVHCNALPFKLTPSPSASPDCTT